MNNFTAAMMLAMSMGMLEVTEVGPLPIQDPDPEEEAK
jgi:hypothetical protein